jgi:hypothetical protein
LTGTRISAYSPSVHTLITDRFTIRNAASPLRLLLLLRLARS